MRKALVFMIAGLLIAMPASAKKKSKKKDVESVTKQVQQQQPDAEGFFSDEEIEKIKQYYYGAEDAQPGDAKGKKKKKLPPGLQKKLDRGGGKISKRVDDLDRVLGVKDSRDRVKT